MLTPNSANSGFNKIMEVTDEMHSIQLEKKLRVPDPVRALEGVWKLVRRTRQQVNMIPGNGATVSSPNWEVLKARKVAKIDAERQKAGAVSLAYRSTFR